MNILAIDSSTEVCSVALGFGADVYVEESRSRSGHSQVILELVAHVLDDAQTSLGDLDLMAVDVGPGSFTGLRIGLGVAKGIAYASRLPVAGFSSLEILCCQSPAGTAVPALDARMGEVYVATYQVRPGSRPGPVDTMRVLKPENVDIPGDNQVIGLGSGWDNYGQYLVRHDRKNIHVLENRVPHASDLARLAALTTDKDWVSAVELEAAYVRDRVVQLPASTA